MDMTPIVDFTLPELIALALSVSGLATLFAWSLIRGGK